MPRLSPPIVSTRLRAQGAADWLTGDVEIDPGVGLLASQDAVAKAIQLDGATAEDAMQLHHYLPGAFVAAELRKWKNTRISASALLALIEAHCGTAPGAGVDSTNYPYLRVAGTTSGSADLPLNVSGQKGFTFESAAASRIAGQDSDEEYAYTSTNYHAWGLSFDLTADTEVQAISIRNADAGGALAATACKVGIWNMTDAPELSSPVAVVDYPNGWTPGDVRKSVVLDREITLSQGKRYLVGFYVPTWLASGDAGDYELTQRGWRGKRLAAAGPIGNVSNLKIRHNNNEEGITSWADMPGDSTSALPDWWCVGKTSGVELAGDHITITGGITGTVATGDYPADLNLRVEIDKGAEQVVS